MPNQQQVTILGATGTIGQNTLDVIRRNSEHISVFALAAFSNVEQLLKDCIEFRPKYAVMVNTDSAKSLSIELSKINLSTQVLTGVEGLIFVAEHQDVDSVMAAIVGAAGLESVIAAALAGKKIMLANKETLVMAGSLFMQAVNQGGALLLPIDSEHNAIFQVIPHPPELDLERVGIEKIILTASGGPFRALDYDSMKNITVEQALNHPNWIMGPKITIDSATLMNKGLEVIEAHWLFNAPADKIQVVVHPQSIIHSMVEYVDGSVLAQLGTPDMRTPIAYALAYPQRITSGVEKLNFFNLCKLEFEQPDFNRFPCLNLAYQALRTGETAPAILNAANEIAVESFIQGKIGFIDIPRLIDDMLCQTEIQSLTSIEQLISIDQEVRKKAVQWVINL